MWKYIAESNLDRTVNFLFIDLLKQHEINKLY